MDFHLLGPRFSRDSSLLAGGSAMLRYASAANEFGTPGLQPGRKQAGLPRQRFLQPFR